MADISTATAGARISVTVPGVGIEAAGKVVDILQDRLIATTDLHLTLKHVHWNVVGPQFIAVHMMLDPQVDAVRVMSDELAERIATLGGSPLGTPGAIVAGRRWNDYALRRDDARKHLGALDSVYSGVIEDYRRGVADADDLDPVTEDLLVAHLHQLELFHWFVRAHLEDSRGVVPDAR